MLSTDKWKQIQTTLGITSDGVPGSGTADAVAARLGIAWATGEIAGPAKPAPGSEPEWMVEARRHIGLDEIPGPRHHPKILSWWEKIKAPFRDDETPWCAAFVGGCLETVGVRSTRSAAARSYSTSPDFRRLSQAAQGCVVVFWRGSPAGWSGHVAFLAGMTASGDLWCLGGNQGDEVSLAKFSPGRLIGFYWPQATNLDPKFFPVRRHSGAVGNFSQNEV